MQRNWDVILSIKLVIEKEIVHIVNAPQVGSDKETTR